MSFLKKRYQGQIKSEMMKKFQYRNPMQMPRVLKVVINRGLGESSSNANAIDQTIEEFRAISGQKPVITRAKKAISNFKVRENQAIGCKVTLRADRMYDFLTKFIFIVLPKIRDFRGVSATSFDGRGSYTVGIRESTIFPEVKIEKVDRVRGFDITIVTSAKTDEEAYELLKLMGMPFRAPYQKTRK